MWALEREVMLEQLQRYGIKDDQILKAMGRVFRHRFIPQEYLTIVNPYGDYPCPIGFNQTISQPFMVAYMTQKIEVQPDRKVLEIGTGSGYQSAVLAELGAQVYTVEIIPGLAEHARETLAAEGYGKVKVLTGDGYKGWPEYSPFDAIIVTCAPEQIPQELVSQLKEGGRMILPLGVGFQDLIILEKTAEGMEKIRDLPVRFVPMVKG